MQIETLTLRSAVERDPGAPMKRPSSGTWKWKMRSTPPLGHALFAIPSQSYWEQTKSPPRSRCICGGWTTLLSHDPDPPVIRRSMAFHDALFGEHAEVDGVIGESAETFRNIALLLGQGHVVITRLRPPDLTPLSEIGVLIDGRMQKRAAATNLRQLATMTVGIGPEFTVGEKTVRTTGATPDKLTAKSADGCVLLSRITLRHDDDGRDAMTSRGCSDGLAVVTSRCCDGVSRHLARAAERIEIDEPTPHTRPTARGSRASRQRQP